MMPQAYAYPARMRATRDLLRRRMYLARQRADLLAHITNTVSQYNLRPLGVSPSHKNQRTNVANHFPDPVVRQMVQLDLDAVEYFDQQLTALELEITRKAKAHDSHAYYLIRSVPGIGKILTLVILYEIDDVNRFPSVQHFASYARLVKW